MADEEFETTDAGASQTEKVESQRLKNGSLVMMKGNPCKVTEVNTAKPGKHGSAKVICKGKDILTGKQYECTFHSGDMVDAPITSRENTFSSTSTINPSSSSPKRARSRPTSTSPKTST